jgi:hypothetical protein
MTIQLIKTKKRELFKVNNQVFRPGNNTYNHLRNKILDLKPFKITKNIHKGRHIGKVLFFEAKGVLPSYGSSLKDMMSRGLRSKLYSKFE